ncbi:MAG: hypothetical protein EAX90_08440 [Candidatus Heimdallarchaeota archaeon]|nr:hypothetical protein [Candidatus Heimdallarchaeota archaeon]
MVSTYFHSQQTENIFYILSYKYSYQSKILNTKKIRINWNTEIHLARKTGIKKQKKEHWSTKINARYNT